MTDEALFTRAAELGVQMRLPRRRRAASSSRPGGTRRGGGVARGRPCGRRRRPARRPAVAPVHTGPLPIEAVVGPASVLVGGQPIELTSRRSGDGSTIELPADLPLGCHVARVRDRRRARARPSSSWPRRRCPVPSEFAGRGGPVRADLRAVGSRPAAALVREPASARPRPQASQASTSCRHCRSYATFLDDPFDPSPYSPISRLHWNEVYLDDAGLPPAPVPRTGLTRRLANARRTATRTTRRSGAVDPNSTRSSTAFVVGASRYRRLRPVPGAARS